MNPESLSELLPMRKLIALRTEHFGKDNQQRDGGE